MSVATTCFKWVDLLETQFDKSWIELDTLLMQLEEDEDLSCLYTKSRRHASSLASCFSQLSHKATVVFQNNAKLEAELVHLREELSATKANIDQVNSEKLYLAKALQDTLSKNHKLQYQTNGSEQAETDNDDDGLKIILNNNSSNFYHLKDSESCSRLVAENERLRTEVIELESEMVGARLDNVYLDKELAGRIQQIQLLLASNTPGDVKEKMWSQIESEMCLQRSKTIAQMCRTKQEVRGRLTIAATPSNKIEVTAAEEKKTSQNGQSQSPGIMKRKESLEETDGEGKRGKQVMVLKNPADDLGMAILGGKDHNLPIIISEIFPNTALARCNRIKAGDIICSVNDEDFTNKTHTEAVNFLSSLRGQIHFDLKGSEDISEDDPSNIDYRFYKLFHPYIAGKSRGEGKSVEYISIPPETPSHPGKAKAVAVIKEDKTPDPEQSPADLPSVHSSPKKELLQIV